MSADSLAFAMPFLIRETRTMMLRVSYSDTPDGQRWRLCGRLAGPWVDEFRSCWSQARERTPLARAIVDLKEVTFIDEAGEKLLAEMETSGVDLVAAGVENRHLVATLKDEASRPLRRRLEDLCASRREPGTPQGGDKI
jgi:hypothetical protein